MLSRCIILVADGGRADVMKQLLEAGDLPNMKRHITDRGAFRTALTVFPSTTGPAHIPFVSGIHPGTANVPGYRWLSRKAHDTKWRSFARHRSLNTPRGLFLGRDMDAAKSTSLFEHFDNPSSVLELVDYCTNRSLYRIVVRRLLGVVRAHKTDDWGPVDDMVERIVIRRIEAGSDCIIGSFFGIDEYSHLYDPHDSRTIDAYRNIDRAIGNIADALKKHDVYDETIIAVVSDHGLTGTDTHIPLVDIMKDSGFRPFYYPRLYRKSTDSAILESGNSMAMMYFKRGMKWGEHWRYEEMSADSRIRPLMDKLLDTEGMSFLIGRAGGNGVTFAGTDGKLLAIRTDGGYDIEVEGVSPLPDHPTGHIKKRVLFETTFDHTYPDAVNQAFMLLKSERTGDLLLSSEPGFDLRYQHEDPEHHGSHGSLHKEHMHVPLAISIPFEQEYVYNYDIVPTILEHTGKKPDKPFDGTILSSNGDLSDEKSPAEDEGQDKNVSARSKWTTIGVTVGIILFGMILTGIFRDDIFGFGQSLMEKYGQGSVDIILFFLTAVSSTPLALPIWGYALVGVAMGYDVPHLALVMALGSASGSFVTFLLGRYMGRRAWVRKRFPDLDKHPWTLGRSRMMVTFFLFLGTASPIPCDVFYAACGLKRYPGPLFWVTMVAGRFVRYIYLGYGFDLFSHFL